MELMQKNLVLFNKQIHSVIGLSYNDKLYDLKNKVELRNCKNIIDTGWCDVEEIEGIELTPELLKKLKFVTTFENSVGLIFQPTKENEILNIKLAYNLTTKKFKYLGKKIEYLHQLQILYFGIELEFLDISGIF